MSVSLHLFSFYLFSLFSFPQTLLLSSLGGNSLAPAWGPSGTWGLGSQNPACRRSLNHHVFSLVWPRSEPALYPAVQTLFCSLQKINLPVFCGLGLGSYQSGEKIRWSVSEATFIQSSYLGPSSLHSQFHSQKQVRLPIRKTSASVFKYIFY